MDLLSNEVMWFEMANQWFKNGMCCRRLMDKIAFFFLPKFSLFTNKSALRRLHCERNRWRSEAKWPIERIDLLPYLILENWPHRYRLNGFQNESNPSQYPYQCWARWLLIVRRESAFVVVQWTLLPSLGWLWNVPTSLVGNVCTIARLIRPSTFLILFL